MADFQNYFNAVPSAQNALDLFKGEWSCRLPDSFGLVASESHVRAYEDYRIEWFEKTAGSFAGKRILELGPLEAGHSYMLNNRGASEIVSIEANSRAYLKCLIIKETLGIRNVRFMLGDFIPYLKSTQDAFDIALASGVLYHQTSPLDLLALLADRCRTLLIWTHCYDAAFLSENPDIGRHFDPVPEVKCIAGYTHRLYHKRYAESLEWKGFCGGGSIEACWLEKGDIIGALEHFGFRILDLVEEKNPNGPALLLAAQKSA
jgi:hypothetical protein